MRIVTSGLRNSLKAWVHRGWRMRKRKGTRDRRMRVGKDFRRNRSRERRKTKRRSDRYRRRKSDNLGETENIIYYHINITQADTVADDRSSERHYWHVKLA